jgi:hypothetical protein
MLIFVIMEALAGLSLWSWLRGKSERSKLKSWTDTPSVPLFSGLLERASGGAIESRPKAIAASVFKAGIRRYVNSDLFDHAVNGMVNQESLLQTYARRIANHFQSKPSADFLNGDGSVSEAFR